MAINKNHIKIEQLDKIGSNYANNLVISSSDLGQMAVFLLKKKAHGLLAGIFFPDALISDIDSFAERNGHGFSDVDMHTACPRCLKAHALVRAKEQGLDPRSIDYVNDIFEGEIGHNGYYLDGDEIIRIE